MSNHLQSRSSSDVPPNFKSQRQHILDLLLAAGGGGGGGGEVPLADIMLCAAQYNYCIYKLRQQGYKILNRQQTRDGVVHSWYRLESAPREIAPESSRKKSARSKSADTPAPSQSRPQPPPSPLQTLSLFPEMAAPAQQPKPERRVWRDPEMNAVKHG
jgi:hypothetical protein